MRTAAVVALGAALAGATASAAPLSAADAMARLCGADAIPLEVRGSRHFVSLTLATPHGPATLRAHVDSGGSTFGLMLRRAAATRLGFADAAALPRTIRLGKKTVALPADVSWYVGDQPDPRGERIAEAQIGARLLAQFLVCIDPEHGRLGLAAPDALAIDAAGALPMRLVEAGRPSRAMYAFVEAKVGGERFALLFEPSTIGWRSAWRAAPE